MVFEANIHQGENRRLGTYKVKSESGEVTWHGLSQLNQRGDKLDHNGHKVDIFFANSWGHDYLIVEHYKGYVDADCTTITAEVSSSADIGHKPASIVLRKSKTYKINPRSITDKP